MIASRVSCWVKTGTMAVSVTTGAPMTGKQRSENVPKDESRTILPHHLKKIYCICDSAGRRSSKARFK